MLLYFVLFSSLLLLLVFLQIVLKKLPFIENLGLSLLITPLVLSFIIFFTIAYLNQEFNAKSLVVIAVFNALVLFTYLIKKGFWSTPLISPINLKGIFKPIPLALVLVVAFTFFSNYFWPIHTWDALTLYDFRAKLLAETGSFYFGLTLGDGGYIYQYPPFTSILHAISYLGGTSYSKIWYSLLFSGFLLIFYVELKKRSSAFKAQIATLILATSPYFLEHATIAYTNFPYAAYFSLGVIYLWNWIKEGSLKDLILGGIFIGSTTWIRESEPFWMLGIVLMLLGLIRHKRNYIAVLMLIFFSVLTSKVWDSYVQSLYESIAPIQNSTSIIATQNDEIHQSLSSLAIVLPNKLSLVISYLYQNIVKVFLLEFSTAAIILFYDFFLSKKGHYLEWATILLLIMIISLGTLYFSYTIVFWQAIGGSATRMSIFLIPLLIYVSAQSSLWKIRKK